MYSTTEILYLIAERFKNHGAIVREDADAGELLLIITYKGSKKELTTKSIQHLFDACSKRIDNYVTQNLEEIESEFS